MQRVIAEESFEKGEGTFYEKEDGGKLYKLNQGNRGRLIDAIGQFPPHWPELCRGYVSSALNVDPTMPTMDPTTVLVNFYNQKASFKWHKDSEDPKLIKTGQGMPVVSLSIGQSCNFGWKMHWDEEEHETIRLDSGDVLTLTLTH